MFLAHTSDKEDDVHEEEDEIDVETAQEKRLRLAKYYLAQLESEGMVARIHTWLSCI